MKTIEATAAVTDDHRLVMDVPISEDVQPGVCRVTVIIPDPSPATGTVGKTQFGRYPFRLASDADTCRREDIYGDDGR